MNSQFLEKMIFFYITSYSVENPQAQVFLNISFPKSSTLVKSCSWSLTIFFGAFRWISCLIFFNFLSKFFCFIWADFIFRFSFSSSSFSHDSHCFYQVKSTGSFFRMEACGKMNGLSCSASSSIWQTKNSFISPQPVLWGFFFNLYLRLWRVKSLSVKRYSFNASDLVVNGYFSESLHWSHTRWSKVSLNM